MGRRSGNLTVTASGTSVVPALVIPFPFVAYTESDACKRLTADLRKKLFAANQQQAFEPNFS